MTTMQQQPAQQQDTSSSPTTLIPTMSQQQQDKNTVFLRLSIMLYVIEEHRTVEGYNFRIYSTWFVHSHSHTHSLFINVITSPAFVLLGVFNHFLYSLRYWQVSAWRFHCLKSSLMASNQHFFVRPRLLFPPTSNSKIFPVHSSLRFPCPNQRSLLHLNTESRLFSFNWIRREFVLAHCSFLMLHFHRGVALSLLSKRCLFSCLRARHSDEWSIVSLTQLLHIWPRAFKEIALQISKSNSSLNFHIRNLLI